MDVLVRPRVNSCRVYLCIRLKGFNATSGVVLGLGIVGSLLNLLLVTKAHSWKPYLGCYIVLYGFFTAGQAVASLFFIIPSTRKKVIDSFPSGNKVRPVVPCQAASTVLNRNSTVSKDLC